MKNYDVFISCKSEDYNLARQVHDFLSRNGYNVFLADAELQLVGRAEYGEVIDEALESAEHLVLLASKPEYVKSTYVKNEWRIFLEEQRCGRKTGNLLTICNGFDCAKLPISLRNLQSFTYDNYQASIINYLPIGSPKGQKAKHTVAEQAKPTKQAPTNEIQRLFLAAEQGDADAQFRLGLKYSKGDGIAQDYAEAVKWYRKAAEQGHAEAQCGLGMLYREGLGAAQDYAEAAKWFRKAAEQGHDLAQCELGVYYARGCGVAQDYAEAVKWYRKAAEQCFPYAQNNLGDCYLRGLGVAQDDAEAVKWYRKAAEQGHTYAQCNLGTCYYNGRGVAQDYAEAVKWYRKAAEQGDAEAQYGLGACYYIAQDNAEAAKWYRKAAEQGHTSAQCNLGAFYYYGQGVIQDYAEAAKWFRKAAEQGNNGAQVQLGICYANGIGVDQNDNLARFWWKKAADQGNETAYSFLPELKYTTSEGVAYQLILNRVNGHKLPVAKVLHDIMEIGISEAKRMVDDAPTILLESSSKYEALQLKRKLELSLGTSYQSLLEIQETSNYPTNSYEVFVTDKSSVPTMILTKYIRDRGNLSIKQAKDLVDSLPGPVFIRCNYDLAESIAQEIRELGAIVEVRRSRT